MGPKNKTKSCHHHKSLRMMSCVEPQCSQGDTSQLPRNEMTLCTAITVTSQLCCVRLLANKRSSNAMGCCLLPDIPPSDSLQSPSINLTSQPCAASPFLLWIWEAHTARRTPLRPIAAPTVTAQQEPNKNILARLTIKSWEQEKTNHVKMQSQKVYQECWKPFSLPSRNTGKGVIDG